MLGDLSGRIVVVQSQRRLCFYSNGNLKKVYPVATGQWAYPTPNGVTRVVWMTKNPTWTPPDSPWAAGATAVRARGRTTPSAWRWIGTGFSRVGIHGVPSSEDWSIGSYASHGCIRMHEWDVEEALWLGRRRHADHHQAVVRALVRRPPNPDPKARPHG